MSNIKHLDTYLHVCIHTYMQTYIQTLRYYKNVKKDKRRGFNNN